MLVDLRESHEDVTGKEVEEALEDVGIVLNANTVPGETRSPFVASGIRAGTPALTTRGFDADDIERVGDSSRARQSYRTTKTLRTKLRRTSQALCERFPLYE